MDVFSIIGVRIEQDLGPNETQLGRLVADGWPVVAQAWADHQTPWQEIQRGIVDQLDRGMVLKPAVKYQSIARKHGVPRDNH